MHRLGIGMGMGFPAHANAYAGRPVISIDTQPTDESVSAPDPVQFVCEASATEGATPAYQWLGAPPDDVAFTPVSGGVYSGEDSDTIEISNSTGLDGWRYRCKVTTTGGATPVRSNDALLTVEA